MAEPAVSVVLPCYNAAGTLAAAVDSIRAQTFHDWELILFDDGSEDASPAIAQGYAAQDARIRAMGSPHVGIVEALRRGCETARGAFIARMDADDVAAPVRLERQVALMIAEPEVALCGTQVRMTGPNVGLGRRRYETWVNGLVSHEAMARELFVECPIPHPTFMMRREAFECVGGYQDRGWAEDYDLCLRLVLAGYRLGKVAEPLLAWHDAPGRLSMTDRRYDPATFRVFKRHYLFQTYLKDRDSFYQWGAGEVGKRWLREWGSRRPEAVVDLHPRKIGRTIHGTRVILREGLPGPGETFTVVAVGARDAHDDIRSWFAPRGYRELQDFVFVA